MTAPAGAGIWDPELESRLKALLSGGTCKSLVNYGLGVMLRLRAGPQHTFLIKVAVGIVPKVVPDFSPHPNG
jgi:hypothetical protein